MLADLLAAHSGNNYDNRLEDRAQAQARFYIANDARMGRALKSFQYKVIEQVNLLSLA
jgi:hypothetical protein